VEAALLSLFQPAGVLADLASQSGVRVPKLVSHDAADHILIMEDLGPLGTVWDMLNPIQCTQDDNEKLCKIWHNRGEVVGRFFGLLHSSASYNKVKSDARLSQILSHSFTESIVYDCAVQPILQRLKQYSITNAEELYDRVVEDFKLPSFTYMPSLSMGDFHPGSILLSQESAPSTMESIIALIDWEFAGMGGRGANGDMAQFLAWMQCYMIALEGQQSTQAVAMAFMRGMCQSYAATANDDVWRESPGDACLEILRSCFILHGREIINQAFDKPWDSDERSIQKMVEKGAWYIERAGKNVEDMLAADNWAELKKEQPSIMLALLRRA
jgi:hypothetical protein